MQLKETLTTIDTYDNISEADLDTQFNQPLDSSHLGKFIDLLHGKLILDAGCGPGRNSKYFQGLGYEVTGIDASKTAIESAKKRVPGVTFYKMDILNLAFKSRHFDGVWCNATFLHVPKEHARAALQSLRNVLKEGGVLFLSLKHGKKKPGYETETYGRPRYESYYSEAEIQDLLIKNGFEILKAETGTEAETGAETTGTGTTGTDTTNTGHVNPKQKWLYVYARRHTE